MFFNTRENTVHEIIKKSLVTRVSAVLMLFSIKQVSFVTISNLESALVFYSRWPRNFNTSLYFM